MEDRVQRSLQPIDVHAGNCSRKPPLLNTSPCYFIGPTRYTRSFLISFAAQHCATVLRPLPYQEDSTNIEHLQSLDGYQNLVDPRSPAGLTPASVPSLLVVRHEERGTSEEVISLCCGMEGATWYFARVPSYQRPY